MPVWLFAVLFVVALTLIGVVTRLNQYGEIDALYVVFAVFFSTNLLISYWEICLFYQRDYIEERGAYWRERLEASGKSPVVEFLLTKVSLARPFSPTLWADAWAVYSVVDGSYVDRRTFGFNCDIANGYFTPLPTLVLYATFTVPFLPAVVAGIVAAMLFWQWVYVSAVYVVSFFVAKRHRQIRRGQVFSHIIVPDSPWVLIPLLGIYVAVRLIIDGDYAVIGVM
ncbi:MAG: hypothetical protein OXQ90_06770 [Gammaproteobacteria bacterium]|nr:hypothetical protein [Gammaproteobacteria bacterium]